MIDCQNVQRELTGQERLDYGLGHAAVWIVCKLGITNNPAKIPGVICESRGCNPTCSGYTPPEPAAVEPAADDKPHGNLIAAELKTPGQLAETLLEALGEPSHRIELPTVEPERVEPQQPEPAAEPTDENK